MTCVTGRMQWVVLGLENNLLHNFHGHHSYYCLLVTYFVVTEYRLTTFHARWNISSFILYTVYFGNYLKFTLQYVWFISECCLRDANFSLKNLKSRLAFFRSKIHKQPLTPYSGFFRNSRAKKHVAQTEGPPKPLDCTMHLQ